VTTGTINDPELAARAAGIRVDAITTDRPTDRPAGLRRELATQARAA